MTSQSESDAKEASPLLHSLQDAVLTGAIRPFRISQGFGHFPLSFDRVGGEGFGPREAGKGITTQEPSLALSLSCTSLPFFFCCLFILFAVLTFSPFLFLEGSFEDMSQEFEGMGRDTFKIVNNLWLALGTGIPILTRISFFFYANASRFS